MQEKPRILIVQARNVDYRLGLWEAIGKRLDLHLLHAGNVSFPAHGYTEIRLHRVKVGPFDFMRGYFRAIQALNPDVIILPDELRWFQFFLTRVLYRKKKFVWLGVDANKSKLLTKLKIFAFNKFNDPLIFYTAGNVTALVEMGLRRDKCHASNNTIFGFDHVRPGNTCFERRDTFINVGSLEPRKQNDVTIKAFAHIVKNYSNRRLKLVFVGSGPDEESLRSLASSLGVADSVKFLGHTSDADKIADYYSTAIASVSFGQAGLAVVQSFANGVPFVTKKGAISGGESQNIIDGYNGMFCEASLNGLVVSMAKLLDDADSAKKMGQQARLHYEAKCSPNQFVEMFWGAISATYDD